MNLKTNDNRLLGFAPVAPGDFDAAVKVIRQSFATVAEAFGLTRENCPTHTSFITEDRLQRDWENNDLMYILWDADTAVGYFSLHRESDTDVELNHVAVLPEMRHFGYGKLILDTAKMYAREHGYKRMNIGIVEESTVLKNWYLKNGFVHDGTRKFDSLPFTVGFMHFDL